MDLLKNKTAVITGAHRGIGLAIAKVFAQNGCNLYLVNRKEDPEFSVSVKKLESLYGGSITIDYADFSNTDEVKNVSKKLLSYKVPFDILVNNVGIANPLSLFAMTKLETIKETFDVNFFSSIVLTQALSRNMMKQRKGSMRQRREHRQDPRPSVGAQPEAHGRHGPQARPYVRHRGRGVPGHARQPRDPSRETRRHHER